MAGLPSFFRNGSRALLRNALPPCRADPLGIALDCHPREGGGPAFSGDKLALRCHYSARATVWPYFGRWLFKGLTRKNVYRHLQRGNPRGAAHIVLDDMSMEPPMPRLVPEIDRESTIARMRV